MTRWLPMMMNSLFYIVDVLYTRILSKYEFDVYIFDQVDACAHQPTNCTLYTLKLPRVLKFVFLLTVNTKHARFFAVLSLCRYFRMKWNISLFCIQYRTTQNTCDTRTQILCLFSQMMKQWRSFKLI